MTFIKYLKISFILYLEKYLINNYFKNIFTEKITHASIIMMQSPSINKPKPKKKNKTNLGGSNYSFKKLKI